MISTKKSTNRITIFNVLTTVLIQGIAFFTAPLFSRLLGTANYGVYSVFSMWVSIVAIVFGLQTFTTIIVAPGEFPDEDQLKYQSSILFLSITSYLSFSLLALVFMKPISVLLKMDPLLCIIMLVQGFATMCISFANAKFTCEFKAESNLILSLTSSVVGIIISLILFNLIPLSINYYARILGVTIGDTLIAIVFCIYIFKKSRTFYNKEYWRFCLPLSVPYIFHSISGILLNQSDKVMIQQILNYSQAGIYSLACSFAGIMTVIYCALNNSWVPFYFEYLRRNKIDEMHKHTRYYLELFTILCIGFVLLSPEVFHLFASSDYWEGCKYIPLFVAATYFTFLYSFPVNYEAFCKNSRIVAITTMVAAAINIILNYFFILWFGALGAVYATVISHAIQFLVHHVSATYFIDKGRYPFNIKTFLPFSLCFISIAIICFIVEDKYIIFRWGIGTCLGIFEILRIYKRKAIF